MLFSGWPWGTGWALRSSTLTEQRKAYITRGLLVAILLHGAYDFFLMQQNIPGLALLSIAGLYLAVKWSLKAIRTHSEISPFKDQDKQND